ncbi:hypothetical protein F183_A30170 [Bryobacterales bacterium F-183]|nr:hypothetical protein F183_A30170 [Bryobacterales bacterium F-183]
MVCLAAFGQVQRLEIEFTGVNCAPCLESLPGRAKRIRGVAEASVDASKGLLKLTMEPVNRVRVEQFRDIIEQDGTKAVRATVLEIRGVMDSDGKLTVPNHPVPYAVESAKPIGAGTVLLKGTIEDLKAMRIKVSEVSVLR